MKAVLISIQPKWCELIAMGKKTVEVRKTKPKLETPFKVYIYQTKGKEILLDVMKDGDTVYGDVYHGKPVFIKTNEKGGYGLYGVHGKTQKVIGEFVCDRIEEIGFSPYMHGMYICKDKSFIEKSCIPFDVMFDYLGEEYGYGWHISDLVIYDKPKELSEFRVIDYEAVQKCENRKQTYYSFTDTGYIKNGMYCRAKDDWCIRCKTKPITRPPQGWFYVE